MISENLAKKLLRYTNSDTLTNLEILSINSNSRNRKSRKITVKYTCEEDKNDGFVSAEHPFYYDDLQDTLIRYLSKDHKITINVDSKSNSVYILGQNSSHSEETLLKSLIAAAESII